MPAAVAPSTVMSEAALIPRRMVLPVALEELAISALTIMVLDEPAGTVNNPAESVKVITLEEMETNSANLVLPSYKYTLLISESVEIPLLSNLMLVTFAALVPAVNTNLVNGANA